ncbi:MAG: CaiB/BaiF CoA-transferase family protein [bacterium]|nr:CaiB/BaiF CoA-transferase family protein [bacterium]
MNTASSLPLSGLRVLEFTHAVMGPTAGLVLADLGAEVIHIEPPQGDPTRRLKGFGTGYFPFYSRNKKSLAIDLKHDDGKAIIHQLVPTADILVENYGPGTMDRLGYGYEAMQALNTRLIYLSLKGFLSGPYEKRTALDEVVQMMGGLAYMTGPPGQPLRAGTSIIDIGGGMFGAMGVITALYERQRSGKGQFIKASLFETTAFLMGQHMAYSALTDGHIPPMPARVSAWSIYRIFETQDGESIFVGVTSDRHWKAFCQAFKRPDWAADVRLDTNNSRIDQGDWLLPAVEAMLKGFSKQEIMTRCEAAGLPFAPIARPEDLFDDPQLNQTGNKGLLPTTLPDGTRTRLPRLPLEMGAHDFGLRHDPPAIGADAEALLAELGYHTDQIQQLRNAGAIA